MKNLGKYNKFWVALVAAIVAGLTQYYGQDSTIVSTVTGLLGALGVYSVSNR
jgi:phage shock protein PspC (stress-responsive transcriptional regulator)